MSKTVRFVTTAVIGGRTYVTAKSAARAFASDVSCSIYERRTEKLGEAAYHDAAWESRWIEYEPKVYRRALPLFKKILS